jgi:signal transduction histidine kinase
LPAATDRVAYRILQESLTNVRKHAGPVEVRLTLREEGGTLHLEVENDGPLVEAMPSGNGAHGLIGMRERVAALGGTLLAGPRPTGGFRVRASLPTGHPA